MTPLCRANDSLLIVIDIQERLSNAMPEKHASRVIKRTALLMQGAQLLGVPMIASEQYPRGLGSTKTALSQLWGEATQPIEKTCFSCCGEDAFTKSVQSSHKRQVILTGMETHVCVLQTAIELQRDGLEVFVVEDAVCSRDKHKHRNALQRLRQADIIVSNSESVLFEWLRDASHEHFKQISGLLKGLDKD
jgi:nicotinamidase-related amidase